MNNHLLCSYLHINGAIVVADLLHAALVTKIFTLLHRATLNTSLRDTGVVAVH
jgi:hypothetical protein